MPIFFESNKDVPYRSEIDGMRALAVSAVLLYHFFPDQLIYGFLGVDIFFVISGYLITLHLLGMPREGKKKFFLNFY